MYSRTYNYFISNLPTTILFCSSPEMQLFYKVRILLHSDALSPSSFQRWTSLRTSFLVIGCTSHVVYRLHRRLWCIHSWQSWGEPKTFHVNRCPTCSTRERHHTWLQQRAVRWTGNRYVNRCFNGASTASRGTFWRVSKREIQAWQWCGLHQNRMYRRVSTRQGNRFPVLYFSF